MEHHNGRQGALGSLVLVPVLDPFFFSLLISIPKAWDVLCFGGLIVM